MTFKKRYKRNCTAYLLFFYNKGSLDEYNALQQENK
jgi:hypothetical protein